MMSDCFFENYANQIFYTLVPGGILILPLVPVPKIFGENPPENLICVPLLDQNQNEGEAKSNFFLLLDNPEPMSTIPLEAIIGFAQPHYIIPAIIPAMFPEVVPAPLLPVFPETEPIFLEPLSSIDSEPEEDENPPEFFTVEDFEEPPANSVKIFVTFLGTITLIFDDEIFIEISVDKNFRICAKNQVAVASQNFGILNAILHPEAKIYQKKNLVEGFIFSRGQCFEFGRDETDPEFQFPEFKLESDSVLVWSVWQSFAWAVKRVSENSEDSEDSEEYADSEDSEDSEDYADSEDSEDSDDEDLLNMPADLNNEDPTIAAFYNGAQIGPQYFGVAMEIANSAQYWQTDPSGDLNIIINDLGIQKSGRNGEISISDRHRLLVINPTDNSVVLQSSGMIISVGKEPNILMEIVADGGSKQICANDDSELFVVNGIKLAAFDEFLNPMKL